MSTSSSGTVGDPPPSALRLSWPGRLLVVAILLRAFLGFDGLDQQGLRCVDEGYYAFQGYSILAGRPGAVWNKPAHDLVVALSYVIFGHSMSAPLLLVGFLGLASVALFYLTAKRLYAGADGLTLAPGICALLASACPYLLFYSRSAYSETTYLVFTLWGLLFHLKGWYGTAENAKEIRPSWSLRDSLLTGLLWGIAFNANPSAAAPIGSICLSTLFLFLWERKSLSGGLLGHFTCIGATAALITVAMVLPFHRMGMLHVDRYLSSVTYHAKTAGTWSLTWKGFLYLIHFGLGLPLLLSIPGTLRLWERSGKKGLLIPGAGLLLFLFYLRVAVTYPRIFLPLTLPFLLLSAPGFDWVLDRLQSWIPFSENAVRPALSCALIAVLLVPTLLSAQRQIPPQSGYAQACEWLLDDDAKAIVTTHSWWTFLAFAACRPAYVDETGNDTGSKTLETILSQEDYEPKMLDLFARARANETTHLVLDYLLWNTLSPKSQERLQAFMDKVPPDVVIPNPVARHEQTVLEDGHIPDLSQVPLAWNIYIYRLSRF